MSEIDLHRDSERILLALDEQGDLSTRPLANHSGLKNTQQVHYRFDAELGPDAAGLIFKASDPGRGGHAKWALTDDGREFVDEHRDEMQQPATEEEAINAAVHLQDKIQSLEERVQSVEGTYGIVQRQWKHLDDNNRELKDTQKTLERQLGEVQGRLSKLEDQVEKIDDKFRDFFGEEWDAER